jgi:hypothetical protein
MRSGSTENKYGDAVDLVSTSLRQWALLPLVNRSQLSGLLGVKSG